MTPPIPAPPNSIVTVAEPATIQGGIRLGYYATWATGPIVIDGPPGVYTVRVFKPPLNPSKPVREESVSLVAIAEPVSPIEQAIAAELAAIKDLGLEMQWRYARVIELQARLEAGETEVPE